MNTNVKESVKNFVLDQVKVEDGFKFIDNSKTVDMYVKGEDDVYILVKSHAFMLYRSQVIWDLCHSCKQSGKLKRMFASEQFELTDEQLQDILIDAVTNIKQVEIAEGDDFIDPRWPDLVKDETEHDVVMYMFTSITLSKEGEETVDELYAEYKRMIIKK